MDSVNGADENDGTIEKPWKTLSKVNSTMFHSGNQILFKRNQTFYGSLSPSGSGIQGAPIKIADYGTGLLPVIDQGDNVIGIKLFNQEYWEIANIEVKGNFSGADNKNGIYISGDKPGQTLNYFRITNCILHDFGANPSDVNFMLLIDSSKTVGQSINDIVIDGCHGYNSKLRLGFVALGNDDARSSNIIMKNCNVHDITDSTMYVTSYKNVLLDSNVLYNMGNTDTSPGLACWLWNCENGIMQNSEAYGVKTHFHDGGGFDIDYKNKDVMVQYCYAHDNMGYGACILGADNAQTTGSVIRHNVLINNNNTASNTLNEYGSITLCTWDEGEITDFKIYDNTIIHNPDRTGSSFKGAFSTSFSNQIKPSLGNGEKLFFNNKIFSKSPELIYAPSDPLNKDAKINFDNNIYWYTGEENPKWRYGDTEYSSLSDYQTSTGQDINSQYTDPMLISPEHTDTGIAQGLSSKGTSSFVREAPDFELENVLGGKVKLSSFKGDTILLSFIQVHNTPGVDNAASTRSQINFVKSMDAQYRSKGIKAIFVDSAYIENNKDSVKSKQINFTYDWMLGDIPLLSDTRNLKIANMYGVKTLPTTFLINADGVLIQRWDDVVLTSQMASKIESILGAYRVGEN